jgi:alpha-mannosidase
MKRRKTLHLVCQAHIDPVWLWPVRDGCAEALTTLQSAVDRAAEIPAFKFTRSSAAVYRWVEEIDPSLWKSVRKLVRAKRWEVVGGWVEQPDCNLPSTESFIRQGLYAGDYFRRSLRTRTRIGYNVDSFGHSGGLPQILRQAGMDAYIFMRPDAKNASDLHPLFWWESPDGSRVLALRINGYSQSYGARADDIERYIREAATKNFPPGFDHGVFFFGVGNHGGGPTREHLARVEELQKDPSLPELKFSTAQEFLDRLRASPAIKKILVVRRELQHVFRGCYAATGETKELHRAAEKALFLAEATAVLAVATGAKTQSGGAEMKEAWWRLLFNQFHDILAGTCIAQTLAETRHRFGATLTVAEEKSRAAVFAMARRVDTRAEKGSVLFVANPLPWKRTALVQFDTFLTPDGTEKITHLESTDGAKIPIQWAEADSSFGPWLMPWGKLTAAVPLPAGGYRVFRIGTEPLKKITGNMSTEQFAKLEEPLAVSPTWAKAKIENLRSLRLHSGVEILRGPMRIVICRDESDTWGQQTDSFRDVIGVAKVISTRVIEEGPHLTITRQRLTWRKSEMELDVIRYGHTRQIGLRVRVNWQEKRQVAKLEIPTRLKNTTVFAKMAGEVARRSPDGRENPCQDWVAMEGTLGEKRATVALLNRASYSYDVRGGDLRMTLVRSAPHAEYGANKVTETNGRYMDQGWQERHFWLAAGAGPWTSLHPDAWAQEWQIPAQAMLDSAHVGMEPWEKSLIEITPPTVSVLALKPAENGRGIIVRVQELSGRKTKAAVRWRNSTHHDWLRPWEIKTWKIGSEKNSTNLSWKECPPSETAPDKKAPAGDKNRRRALR